MTLPPDITQALATMRTPVCAYIYHLDTLRHNINRLRQTLPPGARLLYAMKANSHPDIVATAARHCDGIEVASGGELTTALDAGARHITFGGPAKTDTELTAALQTDIPTTINVESPHELHRLNHIAQHLGTTADIAIRVNRKAATPHGSHKMTGTPTPFGIDVRQLPTALTVARKLPGLNLTGLHLHAVSNNLDADHHADFIQDAIRFAHRTAHRHQLTLRTINIGGGIGVDMTGGPQFDLDTFARRMRHTTTKDTTLVFEPGRYLAATTGWYAAEVIDLKRNHARNFAILRGGTHHFRLPAAWGYSHHPVIHHTTHWPYPWRRPHITNTTVDIAGELCTPRDILARDTPITRLSIGDIMVFPNTGAYAWDISHHNFLSHPPPQFTVIPETFPHGP